ncbi:MAG TPA: hypothetical protein VGM47_02705 [Gammaproteobacteria bacterium]
MNTAVLNINCWLESFAAWLRKPVRSKAVATTTKSMKEEKPRVRIAGLR